LWTATPICSLRDIIGFIKKEATPSSHWTVILWECRLFFGINMNQNL